MEFRRVLFRSAFMAVKLVLEFSPCWLSDRLHRASYEPSNQLRSAAPVSMTSNLRKQTLTGQVTRVLTARISAGPYKRSEVRRVGKEGVITGRLRGSPDL